MAGKSLEALRRAAKDCRDCPLWALGATAAKALLGPAFRITRSRGKLVREEGLPPVLATFHPSYVLRMKSRPEGKEVYGTLVADLGTAARFHRAGQIRQVIQRPGDRS